MVLAWFLLVFRVVKVLSVAMVSPVVKIISLFSIFSTQVMLAKPLLSLSYVAFLYLKPKNTWLGSMM